LILAPRGQFRFAFGPGSFQAHQKEAAAHTLSLGVVERPGLSHDIDEPTDLPAAGLAEI
jgi:2-phospho-L-lactate guanylyltransferase (CobY/MobA/RfbA family)